MFKSTSFNGKTIVITGGAGGIGQSLAEKFLAEGASVFVWDLHEVGLEKLQRQAQGRGEDCHIRVVDVTSAKQMSAALESLLTVRRKVDVWVNNAGMAGLGSFGELSAERFEKVIQLNLGSVVHGSRLALSHMEEFGGGWIINMASVAGHLAAPFMTAYSATKHAVVGFTRALREELRLQNSGVRVMLVSPGFVDTSLISKGEKLGFPSWLEWALATPDHVTHEIMTGLRRQREEVFPTWNGKLMLQLFRFFPNVTLRSSKVLLTRSFKDYLLNRYTVE